MGASVTIVCQINNVLISDDKRKLFMLGAATSEDVYDKNEGDGGNDTKASSDKMTNNKKKKKNKAKKKEA